MPWLNRSLKLHIRLRTISLLISTHNTQVYVQWMPYSFVWLYLIKCVFTCSIFVDSNTKRFLIILGVFGKYFVFTKTGNFKKQCYPILATQSRVIQVACHSRELAGQFWWLVRKWKVQSRGVHRDFYGSSHDSLASETSSREKHLAKFFKTLGLKFFGGCLGEWLATCLSREKSVFCVLKIVFKLFFFFVFPSNFYDCSLSSPFLSQLKLTQTLRFTLVKLHFCIISSPIFKKNVWVFSVSLDFFHVLRLIFLIFELSLWFEIYCVRTWFCLDCWVFVCLVSSMCAFRWLYTDLLYIVTTLGH